SNGSYFVDRLPGPEGRSVTAPNAVFSIVSPGAFNALGIPLKSGRDFQDRDSYDAPFTTIINEARAKQAFPGQDPIGRALPVGKNRAFLKGVPAAVDFVLGGWQVNGIATFQTSTPLQISNGGNNTNLGSPGQRPNNNGKSAKK